MFVFPKNLYTDVRIENVFSTKIIYTMDSVDELKSTSYRGAFIRIFDGERWYYSATSNVENLQQEIDCLAIYAKRNEKVNEHPAVIRLEAHTGSYLQFEVRNVQQVSQQKKMEFLKGYFPLLNENPYIRMWKGSYLDKNIVKEFYSSKGADLKFDFQTTGISFRFSMADGDKTFNGSYQKTANYFDELGNDYDKLKQGIQASEEFLKYAQPIKPGKYTVVLAPVAAGVFAHESFGHKSEADFMIGDENMKKEWAIGSKVGRDLLSIVDNGGYMGSGYIPFDDEGTKCQETYLIKDGLLQGRLHSAATAAYLDEGVTGNSRAIDFEFEPIVRMTTTYIKEGNLTFEELLRDIKEGILVKSVKYGTGMSTFTIAPSTSYMIRDGKIAEPVNISVLTGNVFETMNQIDGLSDTLEIVSFTTGGCGKYEQNSLPVAFGGPYVRVLNMNVL